MPHDVFISHSSIDKTVADAVCAALENSGVRCWIAPRDVQPGRSFAGEITRAIQQSEIMVLVFSAHSNNSEQVLREVQLAVNSHLHIIQFRIEDVLLNDDLRYFLSTPHWLDALTPPLEAHIGRLNTSIKTLLAEPGPPPEPVPRAARIAQRTEPAAGQTGESPDSRMHPVFLRLLELWRQKRPLVIGAAALLLLLLVLLFYPKRTHPISSAAQTGLPPNPFASSQTSNVPPAIAPEETAEETAETTPTPFVIPPEMAEYMRDPTNVPVNPADAVPVKRRFILQHEAKVNDAAFSPDGKRIVTGSEDKTAIVWDAATGRQIGAPLRHDDQVRNVHFSPDGRRIVTVDNAVHLWDSETHQQVGRPIASAKERLISATFSADGLLVAVATENETDAYTISVWNTETGQSVGKLIHGVAYTAYGAPMAFSPDGQRLVTGANEKASRIWDIQTGAPVGDFLRQKSYLCVASFSPDGKTVATWADSTKLRIWNATTGEQLLEIGTEFADHGSTLCFSPDGKLIAAVRGQNYSGWLFDTATGQKRGGEMFLAHSPSIFTPDGSHIVTSRGDTAWIWNVMTGGVSNKDIQHDGPILVMNFNSDGSMLLTASDDHTARVWATTASAASVAPATSSIPVANNIAPADTAPPVGDAPPVPARSTAPSPATLANDMALAMSRRDVDGLVRLYADPADCLDLGVVGPGALRREYEKQFQRWPQFSWQLVGEPVVEQLDSGRCRLAFSISFKAANPATKKSSSGRADEHMLLASDASGAWKIVSQRETVNRTGSAPVVRGEPVNMNTVPPTSAAGERGRRKAEERARQLQSMMFPGYHP